VPGGTSSSIRSDIDAKDLLTAVAHLCVPAPDGGLSYSRRMVTVLIDGLRYGAERPWS
jgi:hypothetical protein